jgi:hypothetical protein
MANYPSSDAVANSRKGIAAVAIVWIMIVLGGMGALAHYAAKSGPQSAAPEKWPARSRIPADPESATLVMFVHPRCPCSKASLGELEKLMARYQGQIGAHLVFLNPEAGEDDWSQTELWRQAEAIPGVLVRQDRAGEEARLFHADTSGQTVLYSREGRLMFQGGVTVSRGHHGDSPGMDALKRLLGEKPQTAPVQAAVFGCSLFDQKVETTEKPCKP